MSKLIVSDEWIKELALSQGINYDRVRRIIIDAEAGQIPLMYIQQYGDDGILELRPPDVRPARIIEDEE